jgi:DNA-directed RNA polymerase sigma subunit (sigma70/sigma32)
MTNVIALPTTSRTISLAEALCELEESERSVIEARWGIGCEPLNDEEIAEKFDCDIEWIWDLHDNALQVLGFLYLTATLLPSASLRAAA